MELLLRLDKLGNVVEGSDELLHARAMAGDDLTTYEESSAFTCYIIYPDYAVSDDRVCGLSLAHLAFGALDDETRLQREPLETIQYIYDSRSKSLLCRVLLDEGHTVTQIYANNPHYASFHWYSTRRYVEQPGIERAALKELGDQFKVRLTLDTGFTLIIRPDIVYFPHDGREFVIKSAALILPTPLAADPRAYLRRNRPLLANSTFSLCYLALDSTGQLTIAHVPRFTVEETPAGRLERVITPRGPAPVAEGRQAWDAALHPSLTCLVCDYAILIPASTS